MPAITTAFAPLATETLVLVERLRQSVVLVHSAYGHGSGVIWCHSGTGSLIVTNHHVVDGNRAEVELAAPSAGGQFDGERPPNLTRLTATVVARDPHNDLALLRVDSGKISPAVVGDSTTLRVGELVIAVGNPFGVRGNATLGIVSAIGNHLWMGQTRRELLQADVALAPGNSGGPLADTRGRVVGIACMIASPGIALAVPAHVVNRFVAALPAARLAA
jgi:serine protease Do